MTFPALPPREGERPRTGPEVPHLQLSQTSPAEVREGLLRWMDAALPGTDWGGSKVSAPGFAHVHADGSLHLALDPADRAAFLSSGWGEKHPLYDHGFNVVMLYAPRDRTELDVAKQVIAASYTYATGRAPMSDAAAA
ncbi:luciferase family protein [Streptomyces sp. NPDC001633]|uniref:luciferase domain-containing protein n=1 Tax=Streptomyces sp. NPDC001633 TaxID=3364595 RepID=UPI0036BF2095